MVQCCVPFCKSRQGSPGKYSFHEFPVTNVRFEWLRRIARKAEGAAGTQWVPSDRSKVCSRHFRQEDYRQDVKIRLLRPDAVPSIFPPPASSSSSSGLAEGQARKRRRPSTDSVPVDCRAPEKDEPMGPITKVLRVARAQRAAASTQAAGKTAASFQKPSQKSLGSSTCSIVQPASSPPKNPVGLPKTGPRKRRVPCCRRSSADQAKASSFPVAVGATALSASKNPSPPHRIRVPSTLPAARSESSPGSAKPAPPFGQPQAVPSPVPLCTSMSASQTSVPTSQTNVVASQIGTSVLQTGTSASQTNVPVLQTSVSASQTSMPALQKNVSALQAGTLSLQTSAPARKTTSGGALQPPPPKQVVRLVQLPNSPVIKGLLPPTMRSQVRIIVPGAAASKPLLVSLKSPPQVIATAATEPAKGDLPPVVHSTHSDLKEGQRGNVSEPVNRPPERHVRTWGSQTRLNQVRLRHMWQRFRTAQRKCLKLQADRQRLQTELAAACQKARQAQAFVKQLKLNRFQEGLSRGDPRCLFLEEQLRCLGQSKHRWREDTLQSCLHWHALAPRGYRLIAQSGLLALPSGSTLKRHLHGTSSATPRNPPSPTGDTLPDNIDWAQVDCSGDQESSGQRLANSDRPGTGQPENEPHSVVEAVSSTEGVASPSSVVLGAEDGAETLARVDRASRETRTVRSDFNLVPASGQRPADTADAESRLSQSVVEVVVSTEEVVSSSSMVLDNLDNAERLQVSQASQEARMACSDFNLVPAATVPSAQGQVRVIYVTVPTSSRDPFSTDSVLPSGMAVLPANRGAVQPLVCSPSLRTESPCSPSAEYVVQVESVAEEQSLEDNSPPKDLAELLNIVGAEPSQM
ncbi:uncharacterized protein LOC144179597 [Haemaphysalis longicornis]